MCKTRGHLHDRLLQLTTHYVQQDDRDGSLSPMTYLVAAVWIHCKLCLWLHSKIRIENCRIETNTGSLHDTGTHYSRILLSPNSTYIMVSYVVPRNFALPAPIFGIEKAFVVSSFSRSQFYMSWGPTRILPTRTSDKIQVQWHCGRR